MKRSKGWGRGQHPALAANVSPLFCPATTVSPGGARGFPFFARAPLGAGDPRD